MFKKSASIKIVKEKLSSLPWLTFKEERNFSTGETNLYYNNGDKLTVLYFDENKKYITGETI